MVQRSGSVRFINRATNPTVYKCRLKVGKQNWENVYCGDDRAQAIRHAERLVSYYIELLAVPETDTDFHGSSRIIICTLRHGATTIKVGYFADDQASHSRK